jgi:hypothetical protein
MKTKIYQKIGKEAKTYYTWDKKSDGGYYNLDAMMGLKNLKKEDVDLIPCYCGFAGVDYCDYCAGLRTPSL